MRTLPLLLVTALASACAQPREVEQPKPITVDNAVLYVIDGRPSTRADFERITAERIEQIEVLKGEAAIERFGDRARGGAVLITTRAATRNTESGVLSKLPDQALYFINGTRTSVDEVRRLSIDSIESIEIVKKNTAVARYGAEARDGAILITTKR